MRRSRNILIICAMLLGLVLVYALPGTGGLGKAKPVSGDFLAVKNIRWGSTDTPLKGLTVSWQNKAGEDKIKWGYTMAYEMGEAAAKSREDYNDMVFSYAFPTVKPDSTIHYSIYNAQTQQWESNRTFKTASDPSAGVFSFTVGGDSRTNVNVWRKVANMWAQRDFVLFVGDLVANGSSESQWDDWYYYGRHLVSGNLMYHTKGNHDNGGIYENQFTLPGNGLYYYFEYGNAVIICLNSEEPGDTEQLLWLESVLADYKHKTWLMVFFHKPFYSAVKHQEDMWAYWDTWWALFDQYGVDLVFNGHTHNYQRTLPINRSMSTTEPVAQYGSGSEDGRCQIISGAAGAPLYDVGFEWWTAQAVRANHHGVVDVEGNVLRFEAIDEYGVTIDSFTLTAPQSILYLDRSTLNFGAAADGTQTPAQTVKIMNTGDGGTLNWSAAASEKWLNVAPAGGIGGGVLSVSVNPEGLAAGTYGGTVTISDQTATGSPQTVSVTLKLLETASAAFGTFETPLQGVRVAGNIPVTGWALDDVGVKNVRIYRDNGVFIGEAVPVCGARPDVAAAYPDLPGNECAGWGYMLLTNFLPNQGNGTFNITAIATDIEGNETILGTKTIMGDNQNSVKPFGTIDTPSQGGTAAGTGYLNFGWALTPKPNAIPVDGSTIIVWVDGVPLGSPVYNRYRKDIAQLFPGYANSDGAVGVFTLDTAAYTDGVHNIAWSVRDDAGNVEGIGSRYFTVLNGNNRNDPRYLKHAAADKAAAHVTGRVPSHVAPLADRPDRTLALRVIKGFTDKGKRLEPDEHGRFIITSVELERLEIHLDIEQSVTTKEKRGEFRNVSSLPIGSSFNRQKGVFYWSPGPGFLGRYELNFEGEESLFPIVIHIMPGNTHR